MNTTDTPSTPTEQSGAATPRCADGEHHWVHRKEPYAPIWVIQCTFCEFYNFEEMLADHDRKVRDAALTEAAHLADLRGLSALAHSIRHLQGEPNA